MSYYPLHDIKRDRKPYGYESLWIRPTWAPEILNTPYLNMKKTGFIAAASGVFVETYRHVKGRFSVLNYVYEFPKNSQQWSIYLREIPRTQNFYRELFKKISFGCVQHTLDAGFKVAMFHYFFGGTWSPLSYTDGNSIKYLLVSMITGFATAWTNYPLSVARKAYYADLTWPENLRKGYRSPLHALLKIPFSEGPLYLFRGGLLPYLGNSLGYGWILYSFIWLKDKFFFLWKYNEVNYSWCKFWILNFSFAISVMGSQPFFTLKEIMDKLPKERGGHKTFNTSYEAFRFLKLNWDIYNTNLASTYFQWFRKYGIVLYLTIWYADNLGMMDNFRCEQNVLENSLQDFLSD